MKIQGKHYTSIWYEESGDRVLYIDQTRLPSELVIRELATIDDAIRAIRDMEVRGAPVIGVVAAFGVYLRQEGKGQRAKISEKREEQREKGPGGEGAKGLGDQTGRPRDLETGRPGDWGTEKIKELLNARPTAVNLKWAVEMMNDDLRFTKTGSEEKAEGRGERAEICEKREGQSEKDVNESKGLPLSVEERERERGPGGEAGGKGPEGIGAVDDLLKRALLIRQAEIDRSRAIGEHGVKLLEEMYARTGRPVQIMTHCNAGWLATVEWGTALAPVYVAQERGIPVHVWVSETRPRNQGANLTLFELQEQGVDCTLIVDNAAGILMQQGKVDLVIVGADRIAANGDVANKIGNSLKAFAARHYGVPFYVAAPTSTFDKTLANGREIPIEERSGEEVAVPMNRDLRFAPSCGLQVAGKGFRVMRVFNPGFDVTEAEFISGYITEDGIREMFKS